MCRFATVTVAHDTKVLGGGVADQTAPGMRSSGGNTQFFFPNGLPVSPEASRADSDCAGRAFLPVNCVRSVSPRV